MVIMDFNRCLVSSSMCGLTVHLALVGENDLAPAARWVDSQRLLETLFDVGAPYSFRIGC